MMNARENNTAPTLYGLVLAGGKSTRMGLDKGQITYHGIAQQEHLYKLLGQVCENVFLSIRQEQLASLSGNFDTIIDQNEFHGPFNGILSAHRKYPEAAWLVLACDLPLIALDALERLVGHRDSTKLATSYASRKTNLPEPLITIWEPKGLQSAVAHMESLESSGPRKFLINSDITLVHPEDDSVLYNANSVFDYEFITTKLQTNHGV